jgi:hypothetical protein
VSEQSARDDYGVVITDETVDVAATAYLRATARPDRPPFDFGLERGLWEQIFDDATATDFARRLEQLPVALRQSVRQEILVRVLPRMAEVARIGMAGVIEDALAQRHLLLSLLDERLPPLPETAPCIPT